MRRKGNGVRRKGANYLSGLSIRNQLEIALATLLRVSTGCSSLGNIAESFYRQQSCYINSTGSSLKLDDIAEVSTGCSSLGNIAEG